MNWTDERTAMLKKLYTEGVSAGQIAVRLGVTCNAVIGKIHRLGLPSRAKPRPPKPRREPAVQRLFCLNSAVSAPPAPSTVLPPKPTHAEPLSQKLTLLQLGPANCRYPIGDIGVPGFYFCGAPILRQGAPYCAYHSQLAYRRT